MIFVVGYNVCMSLKAKSVSVSYARNEFKTVGLVLIIYCLFVLYIPLISKELLKIYDISVYRGINVYFAISLFCMLIGTIVPFILLRIRSRKKLSDFNHPTDMDLFDNLVNYVVFFAISIGLIYATMMISQYINVSGQLVSGIGITINGEYMTNIIYIVAFILISPIMEEYAFRGVMLHCLARYGKYFATIASSLVYALAHCSFVEMVPSFFMGLILSKISLYHKSIRPTIFVHGLFNLSLYILFIVPQRYGFYMMIGMLIMIVLAAVLLLSRTYHILKVKKSDTNKRVGIMFLSTPSVFCALALFILYSILLMIF